MRKKMKCILETNDGQSWKVTRLFYVAFGDNQFVSGYAYSGCVLKLDVTTQKRQDSVRIQEACPELLYTIEGG